MAEYKIGDKHYQGDPIGNITALKESDLDSGMNYLAFGWDTGSWAWGGDLETARDTADRTSGATGRFERARNNAISRYMTVVATVDEDLHSPKLAKLFSQESPFSDTPAPVRAEVLREAERLITGDRNRTYGEPMENFENIASLFTTFLRYKLKDAAEITPGDTAGLMILVKLAREMSGPTEDNKLDIAGYAACWAEVDRNV
jgi:hypothetical protein